LWRSGWERFYNKPVTSSGGGENRLKEDKAVWAVFALLSALFAALTSIFAKIGIENA
jgi:hypothetical protein